MKISANSLVVLFLSGLLVVSCKHKDDTTDYEPNGPILAGVVYPDIGMIYTMDSLSGENREKLIEELRKPGEGDSLVLRFGFPSTDSVITTRLIYQPGSIFDSLGPVIHLFLNAECNRTFPKVANQCIGLPPNQQTPQRKAVLLNISGYSTCGPGDGLCIVQQKIVGTKNYFAAFGCPGNPVATQLIFDWVCQ